MFVVVLVLEIIFTPNSMRKRLVRDSGKMEIGIERVKNTDRRRKSLETIGRVWSKEFRGKERERVRDSDSDRPGRKEMNGREGKRRKGMEGRGRKREQHLYDTIAASAIATATDVVC